MTTALKYLFIAFLGYLLGNISTGLLVGRYLTGIDIREHGSGNAGMTNIMRTLGWLPSFITLAGDVVKALLAAWLGMLVMGRNGAYVGGLFAVLGHNWPALLRFRGGKGMASSLGVILLLEPCMGFALLGIQIVVLLATRYMSVASIVTCLVYPALVALLHPGDWMYLLFAALLGALGLFSHRANMRRLRLGTENRLDFSKIRKINRKVD